MLIRDTIHLGLTEYVKMQACTVVVRCLHTGFAARSCARRVEATQGATPLMVAVAVALNTAVFYAGTVHDARCVVLYIRIK